MKDYEDGQPIDIPAGRFVDLRVQMPDVENEDIPVEDVN
ncbi:phage tail fiber protein [Yersinia enterocolitica]